MILKQYIRDENGNKNGVFVADTFQHNNEIHVGVGWSKCKKCDQFKAEFGERIALGRASKTLMRGGRFEYVEPTTIHSLVDDYANFIDRAMRFYKNI